MNLLKRVKVVKCDNQKSWYYWRVGEDFDVEQSPYAANCWQVSNLIKTRDMTVNLLQLDKFDCELIHELNEEED